MGPPIVDGRTGAAVPIVVAFWITFYIWVTSEMYLGWKRRPPATSSKQDRGSRTVLITGVWLSVFLGFFFSFGAQALAIRSGRDGLVVAGILLMVVGIALRWYAIWILGHSFTVDVATRLGQEVVTRGPYRLVRHPSYSGSLLTIVGVLVACANPLALLGLVPAAIGYGYRIRVEEQVLSRDLGEAYRAYARRTRRLIPFVI